MHAYLYTLISLARQECTLLDCSPHFDSDLNGLVDNVVMSDQQSCIYHGRGSWPLDHWFP